MKYYTVREVATILHKRQQFIRYEIAAGRLRAVRLSVRGTRISEEALREYMSKMAAWQEIRPVVAK
jgi:excisionase family DNA binding protein